MSKKRMPFRGRRATALAGVGLMLAQLAAAGQPARVHFGYGQSDKSELCLTWEKNLSATIKDDSKLHLVGHLYHRMHGAACGFAPVISHGPSIPGYAPVLQRPAVVDPNPGADPDDVKWAPVFRPGEMPPAKLDPEVVTPEPLANQTIRLSYKAQGAPRGMLPESLETDSEGSFEVDVSKSYLSSGMVVKAAYYGQMDESGEPLAQDEKKLLPPHLEIDILGKGDAPIDPDKNPAGPTGTYRLGVNLIGWYGEPLSYYRAPKLEEFKPLVKPTGMTHPEVLVSGVAKEIDIKGLSVTGEGTGAGIAVVRAVMGKFKSEPVALPFGANMMLERAGTGTHSATEEVILQRPKGYNDDEGHGGEFFMDEHAQLELKLTSLLSGNALENMPVSWHVGSQVLAPNSGKMGVFLSEKVDSSRPEKGVTGEDGIAGIPVSARHADPDEEHGQNVAEISGKRVYTPAAGFVTIRAEFKGQEKTVDVPFVDSLWLMASLDDKTAAALKALPLWDIRPVNMRLDAYVGPDGKPAQRKLMPLSLEDHSVAVGHDLDWDASGPVSFVGKSVKGKRRVRLTNRQGSGDDNIHAGLAYRSKGQLSRLTGYVVGSAEGSFCLQQQWKGTPSPLRSSRWWGQAGVTLKVEGDLCGKVVDLRPKPIDPDAYHLDPKPLDSVPIKPKS